MIADGVTRAATLGFAAMGVIEILVHTYDVAAGFGLDWSPPTDLCAGALRRLFPDAPAGHEPWPTLLWSTGRAELTRPPPADIMDVDRVRVEPVVDGLE